MPSGCHGAKCCSDAVSNLFRSRCGQPLTCSECVETGSDWRRGGFGAISGQTRATPKLLRTCSDLRNGTETVPNRTGSRL
eukprot:10141425-Lingulodinium_polyedra.AAC.1